MLHLGGFLHVRAQVTPCCRFRTPSQAGASYVSSAQQRQDITAVSVRHRERRGERGTPNPSQGNPRMKKFIAIAAFVAAIFGIAAPVHALDWPGFQHWPASVQRYYWESADTHHGRLSPPTKQAYTLVLGDSVAKYTQYKLNVLHPDWVQDNMDARSVDEVFGLIKYWTWRKHRPPARLVMALGNGPGSWVAADYLKVHEALPDTKILFVTLYRSTEPTPGWPHPPASPELGAKMEELSNGMKQAA